MFVLIFLGKDKNAIITILTTRSRNQREEICANYEKKYNEVQKFMANYIIFCNQLSRIIIITVIAEYTEECRVLYYFNRICVHVLLRNWVKMLRTFYPCY